MKTLKALKKTKYYRPSGLLALAIAAGLGQLALSNIGYTHGDVQPQAVNTEGLDAIGEEFVEQNPYRLAGGCLLYTSPSPRD